MRRWERRRGPESVHQNDFRFDRGIAARIEHLARMNFLNLGYDVHDSSFVLHVFGMLEIISDA